MRKQLSHTEIELKNDPLLTHINSVLELEIKLPQVVDSLSIGDQFRVIVEGEMRTYQKIGMKKLKEI